MTVNLDFSGGTATYSTDFTGVASIVIPAGATVGTTVLTGVDDALAEGNETVNVSIGSVVATLATGVTDTYTAILTEPVKPTVSLSVDKFTVAEEGGIIEVRASLDAITTEQVQVPLV